MTPARSLLIKLSLLAGVAALVVWVGWPVEDPAGSDQATQAVPQETVAVRPGGVASVSPNAPRQAAERASKLDLNRATSEELKRLPGVGEVLAQRMIDRRKTTGGFKTVEDLLTVKGIGPKRLQQLRPLLTVRPVAARHAAQPAIRPAVAPKDHL
jgi:competence protein ComEA